MIHKTTIHGGIREEIIMYTLLNENFINMVRSFYPTVKVASGGEEIIVRCFSSKIYLCIIVRSVVSRVL